MVPRISNVLNLLLVLFWFSVILAFAEGAFSPGVPNKALLDATLSDVFSEQTSLRYDSDSEVVSLLILFLSLIVSLVSSVMLFMRKRLGIVLFAGTYAFMTVVMGIIWWNKVNYDIGFFDMLQTISTLGDGAILFIILFLPTEAGFPPKRQGGHPETAFY